MEQCVIIVFLFSTQILLIVLWLKFLQRFFFIRKAHRFIPEVLYTLNGLNIVVPHFFEQCGCMLVQHCEKIAKHINNKAFNLCQHLLFEKLSHLKCTAHVRTLQSNKYLATFGANFVPLDSLRVSTGWVNRSPCHALRPTERNTSLKFLCFHLCRRSPRTKASGFLSF